MKFLAKKPAPAASMPWRPGAKSSHVVCLALALLGATTNRADAGYTFTTIDVPGATYATQLGGINDSGEIVGSYASLGGNYHAFAMTGVGSTAITIDVPGGTGDTFANGINNLGQIVGRNNSAGGFLLDGVGGAITPIGAFTPNGINDNGQVVGYDQPVIQYRGVYLAGSGGTPSEFSVPGGSSTVGWGINKSGQITGSIEDGLGSRGFLIDGVGGAPIVLDYPGTSDVTFATGISNNGLVVGTYTTDTDHAFLYDSVVGTFATLDAPGSIATDAFGVNDSGQVVGYYVTYDGSYHFHGFLATPTVVPEPSSLALSVAAASLVLLRAGRSAVRRAGAARPRNRRDPAVDRR